MMEPAELDIGQPNERADREEADRALTQLGRSLKFELVCLLSCLFVYQLAALSLSLSATATLPNAQRPPSQSSPLKVRLAQRNCISQLGRPADSGPAPNSNRSPCQLSDEAASPTVRQPTAAGGLLIYPLIRPTGCTDSLELAHFATGSHKDALMRAKQIKQQ